MNDFTCEKCNITFKKDWSEEEAKQEFQVAPWNIAGDKVGLICHDCFQEFTEWFDALTPEDHRRILESRNE